jgi:uncharacterized surface protein with fasciclin (FAS1) repeats
MMKRNGTLSAAALAAAVTLFAVPPAVAQVGTQTGVTAAPTSPTMQAAHERGFHEWARGVEATGLAPRLVGGRHTVFIGDDPAYLRVPATQRQVWQTDPAAQRAAFGHTIVPERLTLQDLRTRQYVTTVDGQRLTVRTEGDRVWIGDALITEGDIAAGEMGMIHTIDRVTWPREMVRK